MRCAATALRRLLIRQNLGGQLPPLPPSFRHPCLMVDPVPSHKSIEPKLIGVKDEETSDLTFKKCEEYHN